MSSGNRTPDRWKLWTPEAVQAASAHAIKQRKEQAVKLELEAALEARCVAKVETAGGLALKLQIPGVRGFPDRTVLAMGGRVWFFETKRVKSGRVSSQQKRWQVLLHQMGFGFYLVDSDADFDVALAKELSK